MVAAGRAQVAQRAERVEAGVERTGQALAEGVEPQRGGPGDDADRVHRPDRVPVADALDVVPHAVAVDLVRAGRLRDLEHPPVDVRGHPGEHLLRRGAEPLGPLAPHQLVVAADPAGGDDHRLGRERELARRLARRRLAALDGLGSSSAPATPRDRAVGGDELVDAVAEAQLDEPARDGLAHAALERRHDAGARAPGDVEARDRVAMAVGEVAAALRPAGVGQPAHPLGVQPGALLARAERDVGLRPAARPLVLGPVEARRAEPVLQREVVGVLHAHAALLGAVDEHQPAERPERLAAEATPPAPGRAGSRAGRRRPAPPSPPGPRARRRRR